MARRAYAILSILALIGTYVLFPPPAVAAEDVFTWSHPETGFTVKAEQVKRGRTYQVELTSSEGEQLRMDLDIRGARVTAVIDDELVVEYIPASKAALPPEAQASGVGPVDSILVRYRGRVARSPLQLPMLAATQTPKAELPEAFRLAQEGLQERHDASFYRALESSVDGLARAVEASRSADLAQATLSTERVEGSGNQLRTKGALPDWLHCVVSAVGWVGSWSCFLSCVTVVGCFACAGVHTVVTATMVDTCSALAK